MAMGCRRDSDDLLANGSGGHAFGIVHIYAHTQQHPSTSAATKIPESLLGVLMSYMTTTHLVMQLGQKLIYFLGVQA